MSRKVKLSMSITKHHDMKSQKEVEAELFAFLIQAIHRDEIRYTPPDAVIFGKDP